MRKELSERILYLRKNNVSYGDIADLTGGKIHRTAIWRFMKTGSGLSRERENLLLALVSAYRPIDGFDEVYDARVLFGIIERRGVGWVNSKVMDFDNVLEDED